MLSRDQVAWMHTCPGAAARWHLVNADLDRPDTTATRTSYRRIYLHSKIPLGSVVHVVMQPLLEWYSFVLVHDGTRSCDCVRGRLVITLTVSCGSVLQDVLHLLLELSHPSGYNPFVGVRCSKDSLSSGLSPRYPPFSAQQNCCSECSDMVKRLLPGVTTRGP